MGSGRDGGRNSVRDDGKDGSAIEWHSAPEELGFFLENHTFPAVCPCCGRSGIHLYLRAHSEKRGGLWIWCSSCGIFEHSSIIPPSYWENDTIVEEANLSAVPDYLETRKEEIDQYISEHYRGLDSDRCAACIRRSDFSHLKCPQCGEPGIRAGLEGHSLVFRCGKCGYETVGASFFAPCEADRNSYRLRIMDSGRSAGTIARIGAMLHINAMELKRCMESGEFLPGSWPLKEMMEIESFLTTMKVTNEIWPLLRYSRFHECDLKVR